MKLLGSLTALSAVVLAASLAAQQGDGAPKPGAARHIQPIPQPRFELPAPPNPNQGPAVGLGAPLTPLHTARADPAGGEYGVWAAGGKYKASFHGDMTFFPYLGRDYPRNRQLSWHTTSVVSGSQRLLEDREKPARYYTDYRYEYRYGNVIEAYDILEHGLEQTFVFPNPPQAAGDLVITGRIATDLSAREFAGEHRNIVFSDENGNEILTYGEAYAIDSEGRRCNVTTTYDGDAIHLRVPGDFVKRANFPLVVDPLLTPTLLAFGPVGDPDSIDIARDDGNNQVAVCYIRHVSATDQDAWIREFDDGFTNAVNGRLVFTDINTWGVQNIKICNVGRENRWVAVVNRSFPVVWLRFWVQDVTLGTLNTNVTFAPNPNNDNLWFADIGGIERFDQSGFLSIGSDAMCVYMVDNSPGLTHTDSTEIWATRVNVAGGTVTLGTPFHVSAGDGGVDRDFPAITKVSEGEEGGNPTPWVCVWQRYSSTNPSSDDWDVVGKQVFSNDTVSSALYFTINSVPDDTHRIKPKIAGQRGRYLVAYGALPRSGVDKNNAVKGRRMDTERFNWPVGGAIQKFQPHTLWGQFTDQRWLVGDVAYDADTDSHWAVVSISSRPTGTGNYYVDRVGYNGASVERATVANGLPSPDENVMGGVCYDDDGDRFAIVWGDTTSGVQGKPVFGNYLEFPAETAPSTSGISCSSATITWRGEDQNGNLISANDQQIGNQFAGVQLSGMPSGALSLVVIGFGPASVPVIHPAVGAGCRSNVVIFAQTPIAIGSTAFFNLPLPEFLSPSTLYFQGWHTNAAGNQFLSTARLAVPIVQ